MKRVLIGTPVHYKKQYCFNLFFAHLKALQYPAFDVLIIDNSPDSKFIVQKQKTHSRGNVSYIHIPAISESMGRAAHERLTICYNCIRDVFLYKDYDMLLTLECDVMIPADGLSKLVLVDKSIVQGLYYRKFYGDYIERHKTGLHPLLEGQGLMGITLFTKQVIKAIKFRCDTGGSTAFPDATFFSDAHALGIDSWIHCDVKANHIPGWK